MTKEKKTPSELGAAQTAADLLSATRCNCICSCKTNLGEVTADNSDASTLDDPADDSAVGERVGKTIVTIGLS